VDVVVGSLFPYILEYVAIGSASCGLYQRGFVLDDFAEPNV